MIIESEDFKTLTELISHFIGEDRITVKRVNQVWYARIN